MSWNGKAKGSFVLVLLSLMSAMACSAPSQSTPSSAAATQGPGGDFARLKPIPGYALQPADPDTVADFQDAMTETLGESGEGLVLEAAEALNDQGQRVLIMVFVLVPAPDSSEEALTAELLLGMASGVGGSWEARPDVGYYFMRAPGSDSVLGPLGIEGGRTVLVFVTGNEGAPVEDVVSEIFRE